MAETRRLRRPVDPIVEALANVRRARGLTQDALAVRMGIPRAQSSVSEWESGKGAPNLISLRRWADALGYNLTITPRGESNG